MRRYKGIQIVSDYGLMFGSTVLLQTEQSARKILNVIFTEDFYLTKFIHQFLTTAINVFGVMKKKNGFLSFI